MGSAGTTPSPTSGRTCSGAIAKEHGVGPYGATFADGTAAARVCDAIVESARTGSAVHAAAADR